MTVLAAADPAQPYGAALPWPKRADGRAARVAGAHVVLIDGDAALYVERGGRSLVPLREPEDDWLRAALAALVAFVHAGGAKRLAVERFDSKPIVDSDVLPLLVEAGFLAGPRRAVASTVLRSPVASAPRLRAAAAVGAAAAETLSDERNARQLGGELVERPRHRRADAEQPGIEVAASCAASGAACRRRDRRPASRPRAAGSRASGGRARAARRRARAPRRRGSCRARREPPPRCEARGRARLCSCAMVSSPFAQPSPTRSSRARPRRRARSAYDERLLHAAPRARAARPRAPPRTAPRAAPRVCGVGRRGRRPEQLGRLADPVPLRQPGLQPLDARDVALAVARWPPGVRSGRSRRSGSHLRSVSG